MSTPMKPASQGLDVDGADVLEAKASVRRALLAGFTVICLLFGSIGVWAAATEISGAILASGLVVVDSNIKKVQHPTGGVVGAINVKEGERVKAGDVLVSLDDTVTRANLQLVTKQLDEIAVRETRLKAELRGDTTLVFADDLLARKNEPQIADAIRTEEALFISRLNGREGQKAQLRERIKQLNQEAEGLDAQQTAKKRELELTKKELEALETLEDKALVSLAKITGSRRQVAEAEGNFAQVTAQAAQVRARIAETELQILQLEADVKSEAGKDLRDQQSRMAELTERRTAAFDQLQRISIVAPQGGVVHQLGVHTVGGVINPGELLMMIVPDSDRLVVEAKIEPQNIDQVKVGHQARVRFSAFNQRTTPEFDATVVRISADLTHETQAGQIQAGISPASGIAYYTVRLTLTDEAAKKLTGLTLIPGMPAEVHITTENRTAFSYLMKPLSDQFTRAFRER